MSVINDKLGILLCTSIASALIMLLLEGTRFKDKIKFLNVVIMLLILLQIFAPLLSELGKLSNVFPDGEITDGSDDFQNSGTDDDIIKESARQMALYLKNLICGRFSIADDEINVSVILDKESDIVKVKAVTVSIIKKHMLIGEDISNYVSSLMGCTCTVIDL